MLLEQGARGNRGQRDTLVSGAEQQVEIDFGLLDRIGIELASAARSAPRLKIPALKK